MNNLKAVPLQIVTANRLGDGRVVFLTRTGWSERIEEALVTETKEQAQVALGRAEADAGANRVIGPYAVDVRLERGRPEPLRLRERIRLTGPTVGNSLPHRHAEQSERAA